MYDLEPLKYEGLSTIAWYLPSECKHSNMGLLGRVLLLLTAVLAALGSVQAKKEVREYEKHRLL